MITRILMRRRSGQKGEETAKPVEFCGNRRVLQEPSSCGCENRRILRERSSSANRRVLQEPLSLVSTENSVVRCAANECR